MTKPVKPRVSKHRADMRKAGLKRIQIGVPDSSRRGFAAECRRQARLVRGHPDEQHVMRELDALIDTDGWS
jgi:hypothetical protein